MGFNTYIDIYCTVYWVALIDVIDGQGYKLQIVIAGAERTSGINLESGVVLSDRYIHVVIKIDPDLMN